MTEHINKSNHVNKIIARQLGYALWEERRKRSLRLTSLQQRVNIPQKQLDRIELGKSVPIPYVKKLLEFYKKNIKLDLID